jgi:predicted anti-sigma-YlaC factor YlaD
MSADLHERARRLIALAGPEETWLTAHLESCAACRGFVEDSAEAIHAIRATSVMAERSLVAATRLRVRQRARELQREQERLLATWVCCVAVTLCTVVSTAALWWGCAWIGQQARISAAVWETCLLSFCLTPALLVAVLLLARGTHWVDGNDGFSGDLECR